MKAARQRPVRRTGRRGEGVRLSHLLQLPRRPRHHEPAADQRCRCQAGSGPERSQAELLTLNY